MKTYKDFTEKTDLTWDDFTSEHQLFSFQENGRPIVQIYPCTVRKYVNNIDDIQVYENRGWKKNFCVEFFNNGFTPKHIIGACHNGRENLFYDVIKAILINDNDILRRNQ